MLSKCCLRDNRQYVGSFDDELLLAIYLDTGTCILVVDDLVFSFDFDLVVVPGAGHGGGGRYGDKRRKDFFRKHLLGLEPPDRNAPQ